MARNIQRTLISNGSATGSAVSWPGGRGTFVVEGTFTGATASLQFYSPNGTAIPVSMPNVATVVALTAAGALTFELPPCDIRAVLTGGTPTLMYCYAIGNDAQ